MDALIASILATDTNDLLALLQPIDSWRLPRSDLNAWIKVHNKFDAILEDIIRDYDIDAVQTKPFDPNTKDTLCAILKFERMLLENTTNRKLFVQYDVSIFSFSFLFSARMRPRLLSPSAHASQRLLMPTLLPPSCAVDASSA